MLNQDVLQSMRRSVLCWLATVDEHGWPNVSPKEVFAPMGSGMLVIANIASPTSVRNISANPLVCVTFIDVFVQKGYKLRGRAEVVLSSDARFATWVAPLNDITQGRFRIHSVMGITVTHVEPVVAPSYRLVAGTTEASQVQSAMTTYGVMRNSNDGGLHDAG